MESPLGVSTADLNVEISRYENLIQWLEALENDDSTKLDEQECRPNIENGAVDEKQDKILLNRLGGQYSTGRPLPMETREKIVELAKTGLKPCQISKELRVSHGCVSKLLAKWRKTGTVKPEKIGGSRPKKVLPAVADAIVTYKNWRPLLQSWQIKECLIRDGVCTLNNVPSVSSINKTLRNKLYVKSEPPPTTAVSSCCVVDDNFPTPTPASKNVTCNVNSYSKALNNIVDVTCNYSKISNTAPNYTNNEVERTAHSAWNSKHTTPICPIDDIFSFDFEQLQLPVERADEGVYDLERLLSSSSSTSSFSSSSSSSTTSDFGSASFSSEYNDLLSFFEDAVFD